MKATELDLPLLPSAEQIRRREFATTRRGYDPDQVRDYLGQVADQVAALEEQLRQARLEAEAARAEPRRDPYREVAARIADLLRAADQQAEGILREAREEARRTLEEARAEADRIRLDAQSRAEEARQEGQEALRRAREDAERMLAGLTARRTSLVSQLKEMHERLLGAVRELGSVTGASPEGDGAETAADAASPGQEAGVPRPPAGRPEVEEVDPCYEDLWSSAEAPDLTFEDMSLDLGLDEDEE